jgi:hypothetical protein
MSDDSHATASHPYLASNSYSTPGVGYGGYGGMGFQGGSSFSPHGSYPSYQGYGGYGTPYGCGYNSGVMGDNLWQGFLGQTAETLGRFNNLLSMTRMLVDHISNHGKLLYSKGVELHNWYHSMKNLSEKHSEWLERLGFQIESSWATNEEEEVRRRRMLIRRARTFIILAFVVTVFYLFRKSRRTAQSSKWESIYRGQSFGPMPNSPRMYS